MSDQGQVTHVEARRTVGDKFSTGLQHDHARSGTTEQTRPASNQVGPRMCFGPASLMDFGL